MIGIAISPSRPCGNLGLASPSDLSGLVADLTADSARTPVSIDYAATFATNGTDQLTVTSDTIRLDHTVGVTILMWVKYTSGTYAASCEGGSVGGWRLDFAAGAGRFLVFGTGGALRGNVDLTSAYSPDSPVTVPGRWGMFACQLDVSANKCRIRINRQPWVEADLTGALAASTAATRIGAYSSGAGNGFIGSIGPVLFSKQVLSESEIDEFYGAPGGVTYASLSSGLQAKVAEFFPMSETGASARVGSKAGVSLAVSGTVDRVAGPSHAAPTATGDAVAFWLSGSGGRKDTMAITTARPTYLAAGDSLTGRAAIRFADDATKLMRVAASTSLRAVTMAVVGRSLYRGDIHEALRIGISGSGIYAFIRDYAGIISAAIPGGEIGGAGTGYGANQRTRSADIRILTGSASEATLRINDTAALTHAAMAASNAAGVFVGAESYGPAEDIERVVIYNRALSETEIAQLQTYLRGQHPLPTLSTSDPVVLFSGNSIHFGIGASAVASDIPTLAMADVGFAYGSRWVDVSVPGQTTLECTTNDPARLTPYRNDARRTIVCWTEITNEIYLSGANAATTYQRVKDYVAAVKLALPTNCKIVLTTCLPRGGTYTTRNTVNTSLRAAFPTATAYDHVFLPTDAAFVDCVLADWAAVTGMGADGDESGANYDALHIHPNDSGSALLAPVTADGVRVAVSL